MKVWELEEGKEYIRKQNEQEDLRYMVVVVGGCLNYFNTYHNSWCPSRICYNEIKDVDLEEYNPHTEQ